MNKKWHLSYQARKRYGEQMEKKFQAEVRCHCSGAFSAIGLLRPGFPDFTCENCGQLVDVKASPQSEQTGNLAVSATPWKNYPDDVLLVTYWRGQWHGQYKRYLQPSSALHRPTHAERPTRFVLLACMRLRPLATLGYHL